MYGGGVKGIMLRSRPMGRGPGETVVHGPRASSLRHCVKPGDFTAKTHNWDWKSLLKDTVSSRRG